MPKVLRRSDILAGAVATPEFRQRRGWYAAPTDADCKDWLKRMAARFGLRAAGIVAAYVNQGRWIADCECGSGMAVSPGDKDAVCMDCGATFLVRFPLPTQVTQIEQLLEQRHQRNQNWRPGEAVADLLAENEAHGLEHVLCPECAEVARHWARGSERNG